MEPLSTKDGGWLRSPSPDPPGSTGLSLLEPDNRVGASSSQGGPAAAPSREEFLFHLGCTDTLAADVGETQPGQSLLSTSEAGAGQL